MKEKHIDSLISIGSIVAIGIATSFIIRSYLDILRIKQIKQELNKSNTNE
jgi:hypothetical protein